MDKVSAKPKTDASSSRPPESLTLNITNQTNDDESETSFVSNQAYYDAEMAQYYQYENAADRLESYQEEFLLQQQLTASEAGGFWFTTQICWRLTVYFWDLVIVLLAMVFILAVIFFTFGIIIGLAFSFGTLGMPASGSAQEIFENGVVVGNTIQEIFNTFLDETYDLFLCVQIVIKTYNTAVRLVVAILRLSFETVNNFFGLGVEPIFTTWERTARTEMRMQSRDRARTEAWVVQTIEREMRHMEPLLPESYLPDYRAAMLHKTLRAKRDLEPRGFLPIPEQLCDIFTALLEFISDLITIFGEAVMKFFDILELAFDGVGFSISFVEAVVQMIITEVLNVFPLTECFVDLDDLNNTPPSDYPELFASQFYKHITACIFFLRFKGPLTPPDTPFSNAPGGDPVPNFPGSALAVALCPATNFPVTPDIDPITVILECFQIQKLLNLINTLDYYVYNTLVPLYNALKITVSFLQGQYNYLEGKFEELFGQVQDLFRSAEGQQFSRTCTPNPLPQWADTHPIINLTLPISPPVVWNTISIAQHAQATMRSIKRERLSKTLRERIIEYLERLATRTEADLYLERSLRELTPELREHAATITRAGKDIVRTGLQAFRTDMTMTEIEDALRPSFQGGLIESVRNVANAIRRARGDPEVTAYADTITRAGPAILLNPKRLPRVMKELAARHKNYTEIENGLMTLRFAPGFDIALAELEDETLNELIHLREQVRAHKKRLFNADTKRNGVEPRDVNDFGIIVDGTSFSSFFSVAGYALPAISALGTIAVAVFSSLFAALAFVFPFIINLLSVIVSGVLNNMFSNAGSGNGFLLQYDFFTPYIFAAESTLHDVFVSGFSDVDLGEMIVETVDITKDNINMAINMFIRYQLCHLPLNFPPFTCPRNPHIDDEGRPTETPPEYVIGLLYFPQDVPCANPDFCDGGDCISSGDPSRYCTYEAPCFTVVVCPTTGKDEICLPVDPNCRGGVVQCQIQNCDAPDLLTIPCPATDGTYGKCNSWPLIPERMAPPRLDVTIFTEPDCYALTGVDFDTLRYQDGPVFQKYHFTWGWFRSAEFRRYFWAVTNVGVAFLKTVSRAVIRMPKFPKIAIFAFTGAIPFFFIPNIFGTISIFAIASLTLQEFLYDTGLTIVHIGEFIEHIPFCDRLGVGITEFVRSPDYATNPPFGSFESPGGILLCDAIAFPAFLQFASVWSTIFFLFVAFVGSGGLRLLIQFIFDFGFLLFNYIFWVLRVFYLATRLHQLRIMDMREPEEPTQRAVLRMGSHTPDAINVESDAQKAEHGVLPNNPIHIGAGLVAQLHTNTHAATMRHWLPAMAHGFMTAGRASFYLLTPRGLIDLHEWRPWRQYPTRAVSYAVYDHLTPRDHYNGFPIAHYLYDGNHTRIDADARVVIMPEKTLYRRHNDEHSVRYIPLK